MPSDLWSFTLDFYSRPGGEQACLALQASGANVCLLLFGIWLDRHGVAYQASRAQQAIDLTAPWEQAVVCPLRQLRTQWRTAAGNDAVLRAMREEIKKLEQGAEQALLQRLQFLADGWPTQTLPGEHRWLMALAGEAAGLSRDALDALRATADQS